MKKMKLYVLHADRPFEFMRETECLKTDGSTGRLAHWRGTCRQCGAVFEVTTPATAGAIAMSKAFGRANCDLHKRPARDAWRARG